MTRRAPASWLSMRTLRPRIRACERTDRTTRHALSPAWEACGRPAVSLVSVLSRVTSGALAEPDSRDVSVGNARACARTVSDGPTAGYPLRRTVAFARKGASGTDAGTAGSECERVGGLGGLVPRANGSREPAAEMPPAPSRDRRSPQTRREVQLLVAETHDRALLHALAVDTPPDLCPQGRVRDWRPHLPGLSAPLRVLVEMRDEISDRTRVRSYGVKSVAGRRQFSVPVILRTRRSNERTWSMATTSKSAVLCSRSHASIGML